MLTWNIRNYSQGSPSHIGLQALLKQFKPDCFALTETKLTSKATKRKHSLKLLLAQYQLFTGHANPTHQDRTPSGGVTLAIHRSLT